MKSTIQMVCAVALIAMLLSGCRTSARSNTPTNGTSAPTTMPTTAVTTQPTTQMTTQPTTSTATTNTTSAATTTTGADETDGTDDNANQSRTTPNSRSGMTGQNGTSVVPGGSVK